MDRNIMLLKKYNVLGGMYLTFLLILLLTTTILACTPDCVHATTVNNTTVNNDNIIVDFNNTLLERQNTTTNTVTTEYNETYTNTSVDLGFKPLDIAGGFNYESGSSNSKSVNSTAHDFTELKYHIANDQVATHYINKRTGIDIAKLDKDVKIAIAGFDKDVKIVELNNNLEAHKNDNEFKKYVFDRLLEKSENWDDLYQKAKTFAALMAE